MTTADTRNPSFDRQPSAVLSLSPGRQSRSVAAAPRCRTDHDAPSAGVVPVVEPEPGAEVTPETHSGVADAARQRRLGWLSNTFDPRIASARYRCLLPAAGLRALGWESVFIATPRAAYEQLDSLDCLVFVKTLSTSWLPVGLAAKGKGKPVVLDLCDNVFIEGYPNAGMAKQCDAFRAFVTCASAIVTNGPALSSAVRELAPTTLPVVEIPDQLEQREAVQTLIDALAASNAAKKLGKRKSLLKRLAKLPRQAARAISRAVAARPTRPPPAVEARARSTDNRQTGAPEVPTAVAERQPAAPPSRKKIIWFGNAGAAYSDSGMLSILRVAPYLHQLAGDIDFELVVVSTAPDLYARVIQPLPFRSRFQPWDILRIHDDIASADLAIIPNSWDEFSIAKSANRAVLALSLGTPVVASNLTSLEPLRSCIGIDDWAFNIRSYLTDCERRSRDLGKAQEVIREFYAPEVIAAMWDRLLASLSPRQPGRRDTVAASRALLLTVVVHLQQDLDLLLPVIGAGRWRPEFDVRVIVIASAAANSPRVIRALDSLEVRYRLLDGNDVSNESALRFQVGEALVTASESSVGAHRIAHELVLRAIRAGARTYTVQHGVDNIGLTYFDHVHGPDITFASDIVFTWLPSERLADWVPAETRRKAVGIGRTAKPVKTLLPLPVPAGRPIVGIFENLHWHRYDDEFRERFVAAAVALASARPDYRLLMKPHPAGKWSVRLAERLAGANGGLILANPCDPAWEPFTAPQIVPHLAAVITTPSTVALDAALVGVPVAVVSGGTPEPTAYRRLPLVRSELDWITAVDRALARDPSVAAELSAFAAATVMPGDATRRLLDHVLQDTEVGGERLR